MASLAGMLQARGHRVTGSDQNVYPPMSTQLESLGIEIMSGYKAENTDLERDVTVVGNTIMRGNPELALTLRTVTFNDLGSALSVMVGLTDVSLLTFVNEVIAQRTEIPLVANMLKELK